MRDTTMETSMPPSPIFGASSFRHHEGSPHGLGGYIRGLEAVCSVIQTGWSGVMAGASPQCSFGNRARIPEFDDFYRTASADEREIITKKLWNTVTGALCVVPEKTAETERLAGKLKMGQFMNLDPPTPHFPLQRKFKANGDGSFKLVTEENEDSAPFQDECCLELPPAVSQVSTEAAETPRSPQCLNRFRFGEPGAMSPDEPIPMDFIPELVVEPSPARGERFDSFASISDHRVVETHRLSKSKDTDGNKMINNYVVLGDLGAGSYSKVKLVVKGDDHTSKGYALKIINKERLKKMRHFHGNYMAQARVELAIMKKIAHPRIVRLYEVIDDPTANKMYLLLDYINGGVIAELSREGTCTPLPPNRVAKYLRQIASALSYLHRHNIVHRDIKPSNILLDCNDNCFLCDFGVSAIINDGDDQIEGLEGTPYFLPPELCEGSANVQGKATDIWALGATVYVLLMGTVPFSGDTKIEIMNRIQNDAVFIPLGTDPDVKNLMRVMLNKSPKNRMGLDQLKVHPFVACEGARHPSFEGDAICISRDDVVNAFQSGTVNSVLPKPMTSRARAYIRRYTAQVQVKLRLRRATLAREERRLLATSPLLSPSPPSSLNPVQKCRRFSPIDSPTRTMGSPGRGSLHPLPHLDSLGEKQSQNAWHLDMRPTSPELSPLEKRISHRSIGSMSSAELDVLPFVQGTMK